MQSQQKLDVAAFRNTTDIPEGLIHFNNAGAALPPRAVLKAVKDHLDLEARIGGYEAHDQGMAAIDHFYQAAAEAIGGKISEIAFIENATRAWDMVFYAFDWQAGDKILTSEADYNSNMIAYLHAKDRYGIEMVIVPDNRFGEIDTAALEQLIDDKVRLITVTHIPTNNGLINPVEDVGKIAGKYNIPFLLDACQTVGQLPVNVQEIGCTMLSTTGRKYIRGPRGTGFLWVREDWIEKLNPPFLDNRAADWTAPDQYRIAQTAQRFENWECFFAGKIGLGVALDQMNKIGIEAISGHILSLATELRTKLGDIPEVTVWDTGRQKSGLVTFTIFGFTAREVTNYLREHGINTSVSQTQLTREDQQSANVPATTRASVHAYNTSEEIDKLVTLVQQMLLQDH